VGTTTCSQNVVEGERIKLSLKREKTSQYVWPSFLPWKALFALSGPSSRRQRSENTFALRPPFLLGANGRKCGRERQKNLYFSFLRLKVYKANKWL